MGTPKLEVQKLFLPDTPLELRLAALIPTVKNVGGALSSQNGPPDAPVAYEKVCIHLCVCVAAIRAFVDVGRDVGIVSKILLRGVWAASLLFHSQLSFPIFLSAGFTAFGLFFGQCRPP